MAMSSRDRIDRGLHALKAGLAFGTPGSPARAGMHRKADVLWARSSPGFRHAPG